MKQKWHEQRIRPLNCVQSTAAATTKYIRMSLEQMNGITFALERRTFDEKEGILQQGKRIEYYNDEYPHKKKE